jgi:ribulose-phosphate 3-epimerase
MSEDSGRLKKLRKKDKMANIIPAILARDSIEFAQRIRLVESSVEFVQIDVMDKKFVPFKSWAEPEVIKTIPTPLKYELHLMVADPLTEIKRWKDIKNVKRVIFHIEVKKDAGRIVSALKRKKYKVGIAINPRTPLSKIEKLISRIDTVLFLGVTPGKSGQKFQPNVLKKIQDLRKRFPKVIISVDGGVDLKNAPKLLAAGADTLCAASTVYKSKSPKKVIYQFKNLKK